MSWTRIDDCEAPRLPHEFYTAVVSGDLEGLKRTITPELDLETLFGDGWDDMTALHLSPETIQLLLDLGADVNSTFAKYATLSPRASTALWVAVYDKRRFRNFFSSDFKDQVGTIDILASHGAEFPPSTEVYDSWSEANLEPSDFCPPIAQNEDTLFPKALSSGSKVLWTSYLKKRRGLSLSEPMGPGTNHVPLNLVRMLEDFGRRDGRYSALRAAGWEFDDKMSQDWRQERVEMARIPLNSREKHNSQDKDLIGTLCFFSTSGNLQLMELMLDRGADPSAGGHNGNVATLAACGSCCIPFSTIKAITELLLKYGGTLDSRIQERPHHRNQPFLLLAYVPGNTCLHEWTNRRDLETLQYLLDAGADLNATNDRGETIIMRFAIKMGDVIKDKYRPPQNNYASFKTLIQAGANIDARDNLGGTLLHHFASSFDRLCQGALIKMWDIKESPFVVSAREDAVLCLKLLLPGNVSVTNSVEVICTTCYVKGKATVKFTVDGDFDASEAFANFTTDVAEEITSLGQQVVDYVDDYFDGVVTSLGDGIDAEDFDFPPIDFDFDVDIPEIPECKLEFRFDDLELYMLIDTVLSSSATYTLNLYTSNTPIGLSSKDDVRIGVTYSIDLILSVDGEIDISTGFHLKLDDGTAINIAMFSKDVSSITLNGGQFEFLPVTLESAGVVFKAVLRIGLQAGIKVSTPDISVLGIDVVEASAGVEVGVYANVAEFITNVTVSAGDDDEECGLRIAESYQLALGANAGASVALGEHTWGPVPATEIPVFYTTLAEACAIKKSPATGIPPAPTSTADLERRADDEEGLTTTTLTTKVVYVGVACMSTGLVNCPVSLQSTTKSTATKTLVTAVPSGSSAAFPETIQTTVSKTVAFGNGAQKILASSGSPVSYVPPPTTSAPAPTSSGSGGGGADEFFNSETGGVSNRVIIGVSIGLGVPVLIGAIAGLVFFMRRRKYAPVKTEEVVLSGSDPSGSELNDAVFNKPVPKPTGTR
ncbi:uncharacterized protein DNG_07063 [Cephalotrichum gorgonifer]|uniref:Uncharacterized protein n=1 Tax=Cephalotrichum gorgonifer TaxID=2041049 RepID=A0AAE8SX42_9PEZI|nr:uncharacterized protein DNG_07063 [Cephalotrichum gorgonifer]